MKKFIVSLLIVALLACLPVAAAERKLTLDRAILISDTQIILEFSEPIAINLEQTNYGPFISVRLINSSGGLLSVTDSKSEYYGTKLQWTGSYKYVDSKHDRLIWTLNNTSSTLGINKITDILNYKGALADYTKYKVVLQVEEVPYDTTTVPADFKICNVTTRDGEVYLSPTIPNKWEKCNLPITVNFGYAVDLSATESTKEAVRYDYSLIDRVQVDETVTPEPEPELTPVEVLKNDPMIIAAILGAGVLLSVVVFILLVTKKRKAVS